MISSVTNELFHQNPLSKEFKLKIKKKNKRGKKEIILKGNN